MFKNLFNFNKDKETSICPYCFTQIKHNDVLFRCCKKNIPSKKSRKDYEICPECNNKTYRKACPSCFKELPYTFGHQKDLIISIIGAKEAGKSHYIAVLLDKIMNELGEKFQCALQPLNDETINRYREDFYNPVFKRKETIQVTLSAKTNTINQRPLLYSLTFYDSNSSGNNKIKNVVTLAFFDTAGEDLNDEDTMNTVNKYIYNSSGIIFLLDPLQLSGIRDRLPGNVDLPEENAEVGDLIARVGNLIRKGRRIPGNEPLDIPIAVSFSKIDALDDVIDDSSVLKYDSKHIMRGKLDVDDFNATNTEVKSLIISSGANHFMSQINAHFQNYSCFGISSLGCNPHKTHAINRLRPRRIEDPFLWLLWKNNVIS